MISVLKLVFISDTLVIYATFTSFTSGSDSNACCQAWLAMRAKYARESKKQRGRSGAGRDGLAVPTWHLFK